jgi:glutamyl-Q tRNA(Asp) synthetase
LITRFAPSPTGLLHLGHAFSALTAFDAARAAQSKFGGGRFLLRIEDIDQGRARPEFETAILEDLAWLGLSWEEPVWRQSERMHIYRAALEQLETRGLIYRCFKTRKEIAEASANAPHEFAEAYRGAALPAEDEALLLAQGAAFAWRLAMDKACTEAGPLFFEDESSDDKIGHQRAAPELQGDVILARKDTPASYHLASVVDDAAQGVTHVIRGEDLREAAHLHVLLQNLLSLPQPVYRHHGLIQGGDGKRLAKRDQASSLRSLREAGKTPDEIRAMVGVA